MAIQNFLISLLLRGHSLGSQLLREDIRSGIPTKKPVSSLSYRRMKRGSQVTVLVTAAFVSGACYSRWQSGTCSSLTLKVKLPKKGEMQEKVAKGIKADLPVRVGGYKILDRKNCDLFKWDKNIQNVETRTPLQAIQVVLPLAVLKTQRAWHCSLHHGMATETGRVNPGC